MKGWKVGQSAFMAEALSFMEFPIALALSNKGLMVEKQGISSSYYRNSLVFWTPGDLSLTDASKDSPPVQFITSGKPVVWDGFCAGAYSIGTFPNWTSSIQATKVVATCVLGFQVV